MRILPNRIKMSYDEYDRLCENFEKGIIPEKYNVSSWWPSPEQIKELIEPNFEDCLEMVVYQLTKNDPPCTQEEKLSQKMLNKLILERVKFYER